MTCNVKDFYLNITLERYKYMRLSIELMPKNIIDQYNLRPLMHNGYVSIKIRKGMYGLPQGGLLVN